MQSFYSNGKLLLTGEYVVLDGAKSLALPTKYGQSLTIEEIDQQKLLWKSLDHKGSIWFEDELSVDNLKKSFAQSEDDTLKRLFEVIISAKQLNPNFLTTDGGYSITTKLDFPRDWGLGSSSTLINNIAQWAKVDPYKLLYATFGGSGYDIACAQHNTPIVYRKTHDTPIVEPVSFHPTFSEHLYFIHLNKKQDSRKAIAQYKKTSSSQKNLIEEISTLTDSFLECDHLELFCELLDKHEKFISNRLDIPPVKQQLFSDFSGSIKSLGAWGGDFVLVASKKDPKPYFQSKGYETVIAYNDLIL